LEQQIRKATELAESFEKIENLKAIITGKEDLVENLQKALDSANQL
jgi:hypothetical protein